MTRSQRDGLLLILVSAAGYSFFSIFTKVVYDSGMGNPLDILVWRFVLAAPLAWLYVALSHRTSKPLMDSPSLYSAKPPAGTGRAMADRACRSVSHWGGGVQAKLSTLSGLPRLRLLALGFLFGGVAMLAFFGLQRMPVSLYTVLIYTYPAIVAVGGLLFGERLSGLGWLALGLTLVGVVLTVPNIFNGFGGVDPLGVLLVLANACGYAIYILLSGRLLRGLHDLARASVWSISGSLLFALCVVAVRGIRAESVAVPPNIGAWGGLVGLILIATILPIVTFYAGLKRLGAARAAIVSMIEPVLTLIWAVLLRGENLSALQLIGGTFILVSVVLLQLRREHKNENAMLVAVPSAVD